MVFLLEDHVGWPLHKDLKKAKPVAVVGAAGAEAPGVSAEDAFAVLQNAANFHNPEAFTSITEGITSSAMLRFCDTGSFALILSGLKKVPLKLFQIFVDFFDKS